MKNQNGSTAKHPFALRPASREEAGLFYSDEEQDDVLGTVGHVRMDFGSGGKQFWSTWWPHNGDQLNTPEFKEELQMIVDALRQDGPLQSLSAMNSYCWHHGGEISKNDRIYGYIAETAHYRFCLRCTPRPGEYQGYLYCYDLRQQRMQQQDHLVGRVTYASGEQQEFTDPQEYLRTIREELPYATTSPTSPTTPPLPWSPSTGEIPCLLSRTCRRSSPAPGTSRAATRSSIRPPSLEMPGGCWRTTSPPSRTMCWTPRRRPWVLPPGRR